MKLSKALNTFYYSTALCDLRLMNKQIVDENITYNSLLYMDIIYTMNGTCTVSKLAEMLHVSKPGVTAKVNELLRQGVITKTPAPEDKRTHYLAINDEAISQYKFYRKQNLKAIQRITESFTTEEINQFCKMLDMISEINFEEINGG